MGPLETIDAIAKAIETNPWFQLVTGSLQLMGIVTLALVVLTIKSLVEAALQKDEKGDNEDE
jgi:hypothetical protein